MKSLAPVFVALLCTGCPTRDPEIAPLAKEPKPIEVTTATARCPSPSAIVEVEGDEARAILASDPVEVPPNWRIADEGSSISANDGRTYSLEAGGPASIPVFNDVVARKGGKRLWEAPGFGVAGGAFSIALSPRDSIVARSYSRGMTDLFDAADGHAIGNVGNASVVAPNDAYVVDVPTILFGIESLTHPEVEIVRPHGARQAIAHVQSESDRVAAAICGTGDTFALAWASGPVEIFRGDDAARVAGFEKAGPTGSPAFTRSGRALVLRGGDDGTTPLRVFALR
jgi:hypothetical protein